LQSDARFLVLSWLLQSMVRLVLKVVYEIQYR
jgi:hypothetical protein